MKGELPDAVDQTEEGDFLLCANCLSLITPRQAAITVNGGHRHTFANPSGLVFTIGCFKWAPGCAAVGEATGDFSWFAGYRWRVVMCAACQSHLGWRFESDGSTFYGLILSNLVGADFPSGNA